MSMTARELFDEFSPPPPIHALFETSSHKIEPAKPSLEEFLGDPITHTRNFLNETREFREKLAALRSETKAERKAAQEVAKSCGELATLFYDVHEKGSAFDDPTSKTVAGLIEEIAMELEDIAESEALAASRPFARAVNRELQKLGLVTQKDAQP